MSKKWNILKRISAGLLVFALLLMLPVQPVLAKDPGESTGYDYDESDQERVHVIVTVSNDGIPIKGYDDDATTLAHVDIDIPWFSLEPYGLERFNRYHANPGDGTYKDQELIHRPTALHLYIYLLERYFMGVPESECGKGAAELVIGETDATDYHDSVLDMYGKEAYDTFYVDNQTTISYKILNITGSPTSLYMQQFWGHDENLMYYRNHMYPYMRERWGSTADYVLLSDNDTIDLAMFSNWSFWTYGEFMSFEHDTYTCTAGEKLTGKTLKYATKAVSDGGTDSFEVIDGSKLKEYVVLDKNRNLTRKTFASNADGTWSVTFDEPGTYYIVGMDKKAGTKDAAVAPPNAKVVVEPAAVLGDVNQDGSIDQKDASMVREIANGMQTAGEETLKLADVNSDGQVDVLDAAILYGYAAGKLKELPGKLAE